MNWFLGLTASAFCAGVGWYFARMLVEMIAAVIIGPVEEEDPYG